LAGDEVPVLFKGGVIFKQYIPKKHICYDVWFEAFTVTKLNKILLGHQLCQMVKRNHFRNHLCPYHQESDVTGYFKHPLHIPAWNQYMAGWSQVPAMSCLAFSLVFHWTV
jgi:hypothetical protein